MTREPGLPLTTGEGEPPFSLTDEEMRCVLIAYDELLSYWETVGQESSLDDEEMPDPRIPRSLEVLRDLLTRNGYLAATRRRTDC